MTFAYGVDILGKYTNAASVASVQSLGPTWVRVQIHNSSVEYQPPTQGGGPGQGALTYFYNWTTADAQILPWINAGFNVSLTLEGFASWNLDPTCQLPTSQAMVSWGTAMINRYGAGIQSVEMCNEEPSFVTGTCRNASVYIGIISGAYQTLKNLMPRLQIGMFGYTNYNGRTDSSNGNPAYWFQQFCNGGGDPFVDFYNCHMYKNLYAPTQDTPKGCPAVATVINAIINAQNSISSTKPIRVTEFGYQGLPGNNKVTCPNYIGAALQTVYEVQFFNILSSFPQVSHGFLYTDGAGLAGFYDCHDIQSLSTFGAMQTLFSGSQPPLPVIPGIAQQGDSMSLLTQTEPNNQSTFTGGVSIIQDVLTQDAGNLTVANLATVGGLAGGVKGAGSLTNAATITNNGTIAAPGSGVRTVRVQATAACTSAAIATGTIPDQDLRLINAGATAITISTNVSVATTLAASGACAFIWDAGNALWCHLV